MKKITFAVCGMGSRGVVYSGKQLEFPEEMEVTAIADVDPERIKAANKYLHVPEEHLFHSADEMFAQPKLADVMMITTQDAMHKEHALKAMERGYDLLLEKPISNKLEDVVEIANTAKRLGRKVIVCHVLRYTPFYKTVKRLLQEGVVGKIQSIEAAEWVGHRHFAHSYCRGNWHNSKQSSPMILAKCSHDMDIIYWLAEAKCEKVNSFGRLTHYRIENAPEGSAERCSDCPVKCPWRAHDFYLPRIPKWPTNLIHPEPTVENITEALKTSNYGRCIYRMDNDVVDHQTVNMELEGGITATFQMNGFAIVDTRTLHIVGTEGEMMGNFRTHELWYQKFGGERVELTKEELGTETKGHGGGDTGIMRDVLRFFRGEEFDSSSITLIDRSVESHFMAFAAEESRVAGGELVHMDDFKKKIGVE